VERRRGTASNPDRACGSAQLHAPEFDLEILVDVSPTRYAELCLKTGDLVYVSPRRFRVFVPEYAI
jgi:hypothetical protein